VSKNASTGKMVMLGGSKLRNVSALSGEKRRGVTPRRGEEKTGSKKGRRTGDRSHLLRRNQSDVVGGDGVQRDFLIGEWKRQSGGKI